MTAEKNIDIFCISEHFLNKDNIQVSTLKGYQLGTHFCRQNKNRGGCLIFCREGVNYEAVDVNHFIVEQVCEISCVYVVDCDMYVGCVYRSPLSNPTLFLHLFDNFLTWLTLKNKNFIICGDYNLDFNDKNKRLAAQSFADIMTMHGAYRLFNEPTRISKTKNGYLDNAVTNIHNNYVSSTANFDPGISDHCAQIINLKINSENQNQFCQVQVRNFGDDNKSNFVNFVRATEWKCLEGSNAEVSFNNFLEHFYFLFNEAFPLKTKKMFIKKRVNAQWTTAGIKKSSAQIKLLAIENIYNKNPDFINYYRNYKRIYKKVLREAKRMFTDEKIFKAKNSAKEMWKIVNEESGNKTDKSFLSKVKVNQVEISRGPEIAEVLSKHFANIGNNVKPSTTNNLTSNNLGTIVTKSMFLSPVTESEVESILKNFKNTFSSGDDQIPTLILKSVTQYISEPLARLINMSLLEGVFPSKLKIAIVRPIPKKIKDLSVDNFRPIALLSVFSKVYEKVVFTRLVDFLLINGVLSQRQHGYLKGKSTLTAIQSVMKDILSGLEKKNKVMGLFLDLSKAFDCCSHKVLLDKLEYYGVRGLVLNWFKSYLCGRVQYVEFFGKGNVRYRSEMKEINKGVPQGSILGPLLFIIYVNDIFKVQNVGSLTLFADDCTCIIEGKDELTVKKEATRILETLEIFFKNNNLSLNVSKTNFMFFQSSNHIQNENNVIKFRDLTINSASHVKFLGIYLDFNFKWTKHVDFLCNEINKQCYLLLKLSFYCNLSTLKAVYFSKIYSRLINNIVIWGGCSEGHLSRIFKIQKKAVRIMCRKRKTEHCKALFKKLCLLTFPSLVIKEAALFAKNHCDKFNQRNMTCLLDKFSLSVTERSADVFCKRVFNRLPTDIRKIDSLSLFKKRLHGYLLDKAFYSLTEFFTG